MVVVISRLILPLLLIATVVLRPPAALAAELKLSAVALAPCAATDPGAQPGASCYVLTGTVENPGRRPVVDTDVYARILDSSGEPVLQNRTRVGSIGDVDPGSQPFALRLAVPTGTPGPFEVKSARARGFSAPVRSRAGDDEELLPLEQGVISSQPDPGPR
ncbi:MULTISPECIES: hypothetical protein [unclassified Synechococcus]|uniref:hypothetical protein n=1 Tax=unclassified Synechococcus TaxID=2626047 RepID=UPI000068F531|nr:MULTISPECIES: hypothetical protein [unclassified Synechococcus]EAQ69644.1 hypothetical protein RS9917_09421 [Synechococcus sp. RS9917]